MRSYSWRVNLERERKLPLFFEIGKKMSAGEKPLQIFYTCNFNRKITKVSLFRCSICYIVKKDKNKEDCHNDNRTIREDTKIKKIR